MPIEFTVAAAHKVSELIVEDVYKYLKDTTKLTLQKRDIRKKIRALDSQMDKIRMVKTLWQVDKAVDIFSFYCESRVVVEDRRITVSCLNDLGEKRHVVINGVAGQGKSIFLRYLCCNEFVQGQQIPVFVELRKVGLGETLLSHVADFLSCLDIPVDSSVTNYLMAQGRIALFLDGFDELKEEVVISVVREIEQLVMQYEKLKVVITTRPETAIIHSNHFDVVRLDNLRRDEYKRVIRRLSENPEQAKEIISRIAKSSDDLVGLLSTPLLVTLLVMSQKSGHGLPEKLSDFYEQIFPVLLARHDGIKPGFKRPRRTRLSDSRYRRCFEGLCFESKKAAKSDFTFDELVKQSQTVINRLEPTVVAEDFLTDIISTTCLILHEGWDCKFIHRSVQEYYAASYVRNRPDDQVMVFYQRLVSDRKLRARWHQELRFLSQIDPYRFAKHFLLPCAANVMNVRLTDIPTTMPIASLDDAERVLGDIRLFFYSNDGADRPRPGVMVSDSDWFENADSSLFKLDYAPLHQAIETKQFIPLSPSAFPDEVLGRDANFVVRVSDLLKLDHYRSVLMEMTNVYFQKILEEAKAAIAVVAQEDALALDDALDI